MRAKRIRRLAGLAPLVVLLSGPAASLARDHGALRTVSYYGHTVTIPRSWPVYDLAKDPRTCVRLNRPALYLGIPGSEQRCPAGGVGRRQAILLEPPWAHARHVQARSAAFHPGVGLGARAVSGGAAPGRAYYTGLGFDACDVPSAQQMSAWTSHSSYRAIGIYIGGANAACPPSSDPNLTPSWLSHEAAAGWNFIPTYVGLQAPSNSCGCAPIKPARASAEGTAAADDAVNQAQSLDLPSGTPIYNDMEYYTRSQTNTSAVLAFLAAWTNELHARGYASGVYGNANSAIADLASKYGAGYPEPDDVWFADWNGQMTTSDANLPSGEWANHQRLHQYSGGHYETHGGVTLNIDGDYLDGATAENVVTGPPPRPTLSISPATSGVTKLTASWRGLGLARWEVLAGTSRAKLEAIASSSLQGPKTRIAVRSSAPYFAVEALDSSDRVLATSPRRATPPHLAIFGRSAFVAERSGVGRLPVGCYLANACRLVVTVTVGRTILARSATQRVATGSPAIVSFRLGSASRRRLAAAPGGMLAVQIAIRDRDGSSARSGMTLAGYMTRGRGPTRSLYPSPPIAPAVGTDMVSAQGAGGILVRCDAVSACNTKATLSVGRLTIAATRAQPVGGLELGYVSFSLNARGRQLLARARGNQLATSLVLRSGSAVASGRIALARYG